MRFVFALAFILSILAWSQQPKEASSPEPLKFSAALINSGATLKLTWAYDAASTKPAGAFLVNLGSIAAGAGIVPRIEMQIHGRDVHHGKVTYGAAPATAVGRVKPLVICLVRGGAYSLEIPTSQLYVSSDPERQVSLNEVPGKPWSLSI